MRSKKLYFWIGIYLLCILFITIFSRTPSLVRTVRPIPLWSYIDWVKGNWSRGLSIGLNIVLFIPLGYLLTPLWKSRWISILVCFAITLAIEITQYIAYLGYFDVDDIISNLIGSLIGVLCYKQFGDKLNTWQVSLLIIVVGITGCIRASGTSNIYETQFDFDIESVIVEEDCVTITGICDIYQRDLVPYRILLKEQGETYTAETEITSDRFSASVQEDSGELYIQFDGYQPIATSVYIYNSEVNYVPPSTPTPDIDDTDLEFIVKGGTLKAYNTKYDMYVYQVRDVLYWLIGEDFDASIIYHLNTNEPENLPEDRQQYGFDNRGFRIGSEKELTKTLRCGRYRVFSDIIPSEYYITAIAIGMNKGPEIIWREYFRPNRF